MVPTNLKAAAAPKKAYVPGVMHGTSGAQNLKMPDCGYALKWEALKHDIKRGRLERGVTYTWPSLLSQPSFRRWLQ